MPRTIYVPLYNLSFNAGELNPAGLVRADGVVHGGYSYIPTPPFFDPLATQLTGIAEADAVQPFLAHVNLSPRTPVGGGAAPWSIFVYCKGEFYEIVGSSTATGWTITACSPSSPLAANPAADEGAFASFGQSVIFAAGVGAPVQILLDAGTNFIDCFTSTDKPKAKYVAVLGQRLVFGNIGNPGSAGASPDPNGSLLWWGGSDSPRIIGNVQSYPKLLTQFQPIADDQGDIQGLGSGKDRSLVLKKRAIYELTLGGSLGFEVPRRAVGIGCEYPHSIAEIGDDSYFWSTLGPAVFRKGQALLLGDGVQALRDMFNESPPDPELQVLSAAADVDNGLVCWLISYKTYSYTYSVVSDFPVDTEGSAVTTYALLVYNVMSNQLSFAWRSASANGISMVREAAPGTERRFLPLCLVDRIPWRNKLSLSGIGMAAIESAATDAVGPRTPKLFLAGLSSTSSFTPEWTVGQNVVLTTGMLPFAGMNAAVQGIQPVLRSRRAKAMPEMKVVVYTAANAAGAVKRRFPASGSFDLTTYGDSTRRGRINTPGVNEAAYVQIELEIEARTSSPLAYAYLINEIEGLELIFGDARQR